MRRLLVVVAVIAILAGLAAVVAGGQRGGGYRVRAIFDSAANITTGEDVKIAGAKVGTVDALDVTAQQKAAVVLKIDDPGFQDFRADASCIVRPQSLIGEKLVECTPTQPRAVGTPLPAPLQVVADGQPGAGQRLLPVARTSSPVDLDLLGNILRLPYRQRLTILVNELGAGLAGRGEDLRTVLRRADPALAQTDRLLAELAGENRTLAELATQSDTALAPLARERARVADSIVQTNVVARATAERSAALRRDIADLPAFLRQLQPTMARIAALADQTTPVVSNLGAAAPALNRATEQLGPFSRASIPFFETLGQTAQLGTPAVVATRPLLESLQALGTQSAPFGRDLAALLTSAQNSGGIEYLMDFVFLAAAATNGYDELGHFLRAALVLNPCSTYAVTPVAGCNANFVKRQSSARSARAAGSRAPASRPAARPGAGATGASAVASIPAAAAPPAPASNRLDGPARLLNYLLGN